MMNGGFWFVGCETIFVMFFWFCLSSLSIWFSLVPWKITGRDWHLDYDKTQRLPGLGSLYCTAEVYFPQQYTSIVTFHHIR